MDHSSLVVAEGRNEAFLWPSKLNSKSLTPFCSGAYVLLIMYMILIGFAWGRVITFWFFCHCCFESDYCRGEL